MEEDMEVPEDSEIMGAMEQGEEDDNEEEDNDADEVISD
jgi:hypothetical protein